MTVRVEPIKWADQNFTDSQAHARALWRRANRLWFAIIDDVLLTTPEAMNRHTRDEMRDRLAGHLDGRSRNFAKATALLNTGRVKDKRRGLRMRRSLRKSYDEMTSVLHKQLRRAGRSWDGPERGFWLASLDAALDNIEAGKAKSTVRVITTSALNARFSTLSAGGRS